MKKIFFVLLLFISNYGFGQTSIRKTLFQSKYGFEITRRISENDTTSYFGYSFQNNEYKTITDIGIIILYKDDIQEFLEKLTEFSSAEKGVDMDYQNKDYSLFLASDMIMIKDKRKKYNIVTKGYVKKLITDLKLNLHLLE